MAHLNTNQIVYRGMFSKMDNVQFRIMPTDGEDINEHIVDINKAIKEMQITDDELDFVLLSSNYGKVGADEFNKTAFDYFANRFKNVQLIAVGFTPSSISKAMSYKNILAIGTGIPEEERVSLGNLSNKIINNQQLREMITNKSVQKNDKEKTSVQKMTRTIGNLSISEPVSTSQTPNKTAIKP